MANDKGSNQSRARNRSSGVEELGARRNEEE
jgi:hypothetical protein